MRNLYLILSIAGFAVFNVHAEEVHPEVPFFAFENGLRALSSNQRIELLEDLGFDGIGSASPAQLTERLALYDKGGLKIYSLYLGLEAHPDRFELKPGVAEAIKELEGRGETTMIELFVQGKRDDPETRKQAIEGVSKVAALAEESSLRVVLYPHTGFHIDTVEAAFDLANAVGKPNVGVMFNLCHFLRVEPKSDLRETLTKVKPLLWRVSTSGADVSGDNWDALIQPLDSGTFSQSEFFQLLDEIGYRGPVGLQCFGIKNPSRDHLSRSIAAWRQITKSSNKEP